jgi:hypothetical protein
LSKLSLIRRWPPSCVFVGANIRNGKDTTEVKTVMELKALFFATFVAGLLGFGVLLIIVHMMMVAPIPK